MKDLKLRRINSKKFCLYCKELVELKIKGLKGYCPFCGAMLYTIENRKGENGK